MSGGGEAAPIVNEVFTKFYQNASTDDPLVAAMKDVPKAMAVDEGETDDDVNVPRPPRARARTAAAIAPPPPPPQQEKGIGGFFRKLFRRN